MTVDLVDHEALALARAIEPFVDRYKINDPMTGWRPLRNIEMDALRTLRLHELEQLRKSGKCCCEQGPWADGKCRRGPGKCELFKLAETMIWRAENVRADEGISDH